MQLMKEGKKMWGEIESAVDGESIHLQTVLLCKRLSPQSPRRFATILGIEFAKRKVIAAKQPSMVRKYLCHDNGTSLIRTFRIIHF